MEGKKIANAETMIEVALDIHILQNGFPFLSPDTTRLLQSVKQSGSVHSSAKSLGMSYQKAWNLIQNMNQIAGNNLVEKQRGGKGGGGTLLTSYGTLILNEYEQIETQVKRFSLKLNREINF